MARSDHTYCIIRDLDVALPGCDDYLVTIVRKVAASYSPPTTIATACPVSL